jgi:hypothetical protein
MIAIEAVPRLRFASRTFHEEAVVVKIIERLAHRAVPFGLASIRTLG